MMTTVPDEGGGASRSTDPAAGSSAATDISLREYFEALARKDDRFQEERDRRYAEVALEREKALKIKEEADKAALGLAREIQTYKDEKANELREQINSERGLYVTKDELKPIADFVIAQQSSDSTTDRRQTRTQPWMIAAGTAIVSIMLVLVANGRL